MRMVISEIIYLKFSNREQATFPYFFFLLCILKGGEKKI